MVLLRFDPEGVPFPALTRTPAPTPTPSSILLFFLNLGMHFSVFKMLEQEIIWFLALYKFAIISPRRNEVYEIEVQETKGIAGGFIRNTTDNLFD